MSSNGKLDPRRPAIALIAPAARPEEAAAIVAALEQFLHDTTPVYSVRPPASGWGRAALAEGVGLGGPDAWSDMDPWAAGQAC